MEITKTPILSLFCSANRPKLWPTLFGTLSKNTVEYEIIMVGDKKPCFTLPDNVTYIYSEVKPAQCYHIASMHCRGEYLLNIGDDFRYSEGSLDYMMEAFNYEKNPHLTIVSATFSVDDHYLYHNPDAPIVPIGSLMHRALWKKTGGIDINFVGLYWDLDIAMRVMHEFGGKTVICEKAVLTELVLPTATQLNGREYRDWQLFNELWNDGKTLDASQGVHKNANVKDKRTRPPEFYQEKDDILTVSQGPSSSWP